MGDEPKDEEDEDEGGGGGGAMGKDPEAVAGLVNSSTLSVSIQMSGRQINGP